MIALVKSPIALLLSCLVVLGAACSDYEGGGFERRSRSVRMVTARVTGTDMTGLSVRDKPTNASPRVATLEEGSVVEIECLIEGASVGGNAVWAFVEASGGFVPDAYLDGATGFDKDAPRCETSTPPKKKAPPQGGVDGGAVDGGSLDAGGGTGGSTGGGGGTGGITSKAVDIDGPAVRAHVQIFADAACGTVDACTISTYTGHSPSADLALDILTSASYGKVPTDGHAFGDSIAAFALQHEAKYRIDYVIYRQRINTLDGRGWRAMEDRGSITQNHYDHVHVSFLP